MENPILEIDFVAGSHGNFLEFILNKLILKNINYLPFTELGTSHNKLYDKFSMPVQANHYNSSNLKIKSNNVIHIVVTEEDDLLQFMSISLFRSGDLAIKDDELEINTFNKLNNGAYKNLLNDISSSYNIQLNNLQPHCPRHILREFYKFGLKLPSINGYVKASKSSVENYKHQNCFLFPIKSFYEYNLLLTQINEIKNFYKLDFELIDFKEIHDIFLEKLTPFLNLTAQANRIIDAVKTNQLVEIKKLTLLQESYINAKIENAFNIEMPFMQNSYFSNTYEIIEYIHKCSR